MASTTETTNGDPATVSEARLLSVLDTAVDGIIVMDERARVLVYNRACEQLFGYTASETIGHNISMLMPPDYATAHDEYVGHYLRTGERRIIGIGREVRGQRKDGSVFPIELSVGEAMTPEGRQFIGVLRDLTARKADEQRLAHLQGQIVTMARLNAMDEMGAAVAHELNQPLTAVMLYLQAVQRKLLPAMSPEDMDKVRDILQRAVREAERAGNIIQRMRQFVEKREPDRRRVDINKLAEEALELILLGVNQDEIEVRTSFEADLPEIDADPIQIQQILVNLTRNALEAVKAAPEKWIRVATRRIDDRIAVSVQDSGPGLSKEAAAELFKAFATTKRTGLGLGLVISRSIAQNHGGELRVDTGGPGVGAQFTLILPLEPPGGRVHARDGSETPAGK